MLEISRIKYIIFNFVASVLDESTMLFITMLVINVYSTEALGYFSLLLAAAGLIAAPGSSGIASFIMYYIDNENKKDIVKVLAISILLSLVIGFVYFIIQLFGYHQNTKKSISYLSLVFILALTQVGISNLSNFIRAIGGHSWILVFTSVKVLVAFCVLYPTFVYKEFDFFILTYVLYMIFCVFILVFISFKLNLNKSYASNSKSFKVIGSEVFRYSSYIIIASFISSFGMLYIKEYIGSNDGMNTLGYFTIAQQMSLAVVFGASSIGISLFKDLKVSGLAIDKLYLKSSQLLLSGIMFFCILTQELWVGIFNLNDSGSIHVINFIFLYFCFSAYVWMIGPMLAARADGKIYVILTVIRIFPVVIYSFLFEASLFTIIVVMVFSEFLVYYYFTRIKVLSFSFLIDHDVVLLFIIPLIMSAFKYLYVDFYFLEGMCFLGVYLLLRIFMFFIRVFE